MPSQYGFTSPSEDARAKAEAERIAKEQEQQRIALRAQEQQKALNAVSEVARDFERTTGLRWPGRQAEPSFKDTETQPFTVIKYDAREWERIPKEKRSQIYEALRGSLGGRYTLIAIPETVENPPTYSRPLQSSDPFLRSQPTEQEIRQEQLEIEVYRRHEAGGW